MTTTAPENEAPVLVLKANAELHATARAQNIKRIGHLKADESWPMQAVQNANHELKRLVGTVERLDAAASQRMESL